MVTKGDSWSWDSGIDVVKRWSRIEAVSSCSCLPLNPLTVSTLRFLWKVQWHTRRKALKLDRLLLGLVCGHDLQQQPTIHSVVVARGEAK